MATFGVCDFCGDAFLAQRKRKWVACSPRCRTALYRGRCAGQMRELRCSSCGASFLSPVRPGAPKYCETCKTSHRRDLNAKAQRRADRAEKHQCSVCHSVIPIYQKTCSRRCSSVVANSMKPPLNEAARHGARRTREKNAPGLNDRQRRQLLHRWVNQGCVCTYCTGPCETVDHLIPLVRGGTNGEGNLTPACRRCNSRKGTSLLTEWRYGSGRELFKARRSEDQQGQASRRMEVHSQHTNRRPTRPSELENLAA